MRRYDMKRIWDFLKSCSEVKLAFGLIGSANLVMGLIYHDAFGIVLGCVLIISASQIK
jgi:hypothetical protein